MPSWWYRVRADVPSDRRPGGEGCVDRHHQPAILRMATGQPESPSVQDADRPPVDGGAGLERALASLWLEISTQRCTVHKHRNLLAHAPDALHEEITADYNDMIYAENTIEVMHRRKLNLRVVSAATNPARFAVPSATSAPSSSFCHPTAPT